MSLRERIGKFEKSIREIVPSLSINKIDRAQLMCQESYLALCMAINFNGAKECESLVGEYVRLSKNFLVTLSSAKNGSKTQHVEDIAKNVLRRIDIIETERYSGARAAYDLILGYLEAP